MPCHYPDKFGVAGAKFWVVSAIAINLVRYTATSNPNIFSSTTATMVRESFL